MKIKTQYKVKELMEKLRKAVFIKKVKCISSRPTIEHQIIPGNTYYMDTSSIWKDSNGDEYAIFYKDEAGNKKIGNLLVSHFKIEE